eukprot:TRINITY_DN5181_c0_g1_i1.p1 TRINITY_DN5181_c0_g1~~TRINITY_DN5181_c0_g1_i1.p1  ORF type:complete len:519 (+),score=77.44 TRINITY_DN5181_c0_g1_i1:194-1750(+)
MAQQQLLAMIKPVSSTVLGFLPPALSKAIGETDDRKALALTALTCVGASALTLKLLRTLSPSFDEKYFYWSRCFQSYVTYGCSTVMRPVFRKLIGGDHLAPSSADNEIDVHWLLRVLEDALGSHLIRDIDRRELSVEIEAGKLTGGFISDIRRVTLRWPEGADERLPRSLIVKSLPHSRSRYFSSILHGTSREAFFYSEHAKRTTELSALLPRVYFSKGSWLTGEYIVLMEDLSSAGINACVMLGNQCWGAKPIPKELEQDPLYVLENIFLETADFHAKFWRDFSLLDYHWFKTSEWLRGRNRAQWDLAMSIMRRKWDRVQTAVKNGQTKVRWSEKMIQATNTAMELTSWETLQREFDVRNPRTPFTLCHGDYHAGNMLWIGNNRPGRGPAIFVDWSEVGVFCPFTEIAQFMISNATIELRRKHERTLFESYYRRLIEKGVTASEFPLESCWDRYCAGGIEKWLQFMILLANMNLEDPNHLPDFGIQWFHDQVLAFVEDHGDRKSTVSTAFRTGFCIL